jgi:amidohydrolase
MKEHARPYSTAVRPESATGGIMFGSVLRLAWLALLTALFPIAAPPAQAQSIGDAIDHEAKAIESKLIAWRRDIHQNPELGNREFRTSALVAEHLKKLGYDVREKVGHTGVVAVLKGGKPGPVVALRADMDALPVTEEVDLPFASKVRTTWRGKETGVMHACGHDAHTAILMAAAEVFSKLRSELPGTVKLIFQPAEEGAPPGEEGGARLMIKEGALDNPRPEVIFGLHVTSPGRTGAVFYRPGASMAGSDSFRIIVKGKGTHGARPWGGVDPIVIAAQIILGLQTIESRQVDVTSEPSVLTIGMIQAGTRHNIIPDKAEMDGTLRTFNIEMRDFIKRRVTETSEAIAKSGGGEATVEWISEGYIPLINNVALTQRMVPTLQRVAGKENVIEASRRTSSEDFSFYAREIPGFFFHVGMAPPNTPVTLAATNHSPRFQIDEDGLLKGLRYMLHVTFDYMSSGGAGKKTD